MILEVVGFGGPPEAFFPARCEAPLTGALPSPPKSDDRASFPLWLADKPERRAGSGVVIGILTCASY